MAVSYTHLDVYKRQPPVEPVPSAPAVTDTWDESQCDHMNEHCERAPKCTVEGLSLIHI